MIKFFSKSKRKYMSFIIHLMVQNWTTRARGVKCDFDIEFRTRIPWFHSTDSMVYSMVYLCIFYGIFVICSMDISILYGVIWYWVLDLHLLIPFNRFYGRSQCCINLFFLSNRCLYFNLNYVINKTENRRIGTVANQMCSNLCYAKRAPQFREEYN